MLLTVEVSRVRSGSVQPRVLQLMSRLSLSCILIKISSKGCRAVKFQTLKSHWKMFNMFLEILRRNNENRASVDVDPLKGVVVDTRP